MKCPVCRNEMDSIMSFTVGEDNAVNHYHCKHCECDYDLRAKDGKYTGWWKIKKLPILPDTNDNDAEYKLYEFECICTGEVTNEYPLGQFQMQRERFAQMTSAYMDGEGYELVIAREDEFDDEGIPTFEMDDRILCHQGDCGARFHLEAAKNVNRWRDILKM